MERLIVWHRWCPPPEATPEAVAQANLWRIQARERMAALGGESIAELGGTLVSALPAEALVGALEACLAASREAEMEEHLEVGSVAQALTLGRLERALSQGPLVGDALDRAQALAGHAAAGDIVLDQAAQSCSANLYLFSGELRAGPSITGAVLDRSFPHLSRCADALARLGAPPLPKTQQISFDAFRKVARGTGRQRVLLVAADGTGADGWLSRIARELSPPAWLELRGLGAGFAPLSGLRYGLRRLRGESALEAVLNDHEEPDREALLTLTTIREGGAARRREATMALRQYVGRCWEKTGRRPLISVNPASLIDPATLSVVAEVARDGGPECLVVMRILPDGRAPEAFTRGGGLAEVRIPGLAPGEGRAFAQMMLGPDTPPDIARRAAAMGGGTPLCVAEAVRLLVSAGDVVPDGAGFRFRRGPPARPLERQLEAILDQRIELLEADPRRVLEVLAWVPDPCEELLVREVALLDGIDAATLELALDDLVGKSFIELRGDDVRLSHVVRRVVLEGMDPTRARTLSVWVAHVLLHAAPDAAVFGRADVAFYLARGGKPEGAVDLLLEAAMVAAQNGFVRSGVRLAAAAVECQPTRETRRKAASIAESLGRQVVSGGPHRTPAPPAPRVLDTPLPDRPSSPKDLGHEAVRHAIRCLTERDFEGLDRALELMTAAGRGGASIDRLRALGSLCRGDRVTAQQLLARVSVQDSADAAPRTALSRALVRYYDRDALGAIREGLRALAEVREREDSRGETAVLLLLSRFFADLEWPTQASELSHLAQAAYLPDGSVSGSSSQ